MHTRNISVCSWDFLPASAPAYAFKEAVFELSASAFPGRNKRVAVPGLLRAISTHSRASALFARFAGLNNPEARCDPPDKFIRCNACILQLCERQGAE